MFFLTLLFMISNNTLISDSEREVYLHSGNKKILNEEMVEKGWERAMDSLIYYNYDLDTGSHFSWTFPGDSLADTFMVWFDPTVVIPWEFPCSLISFRIYLTNYLDTLNNYEASVFVAKLDQSIDYYNDYNQAQWLITPADDTVGPPPIEEIVYENTHTLYADSGSRWIHHIKETLDVPIDMGMEIFGVGWHRNDGPGMDSICPNPSFWADIEGANSSLPTHSLVQGRADTNEGWFSYYSNLYGAPYCAFAKVRYYTPQGIEEGKEYINSVRFIQSLGKEIILELESSDKRDAEIEVFDIIGRNVRNIKIHLSQGMNRYSIENLPSGIYFMRTTHTDSKMHKFTVIK